ncbi:PAS domain S-box protein [Chitinispirillales bacterium ANBcel5]|uniref:PAS domain S-box protein n=1 Tax=Cellulosispirillum alkaliphilum TaxID=3039283 RepID=UPI002A502861|nr:PAS domain S-box protein [Chitinispirillales bacterium ANBcel5]
MEKKLNTTDTIRVFADKFLDHINTPLLVINDDLTVCCANRAYCAKFTVQRESVENRPIHELEDGMWVKHEAGILLKRVLAEDKGFNNLEICIRKKMHPHYFILSANPTEFDKKLILVTIEDITEKRRTEQRLQNIKTHEETLKKQLLEIAISNKKLEDKNRLLESLLRSIPEGIMITDKENRVQALSCYFEHLFGIDPQRIQKAGEKERTRLMNLYAPGGEEVSHKDLPLAKVINEKKPIDNYELLFKQNGQSRHVTINAAPIFDSEGEIKGAVGVWTDITDRKKAQVALHENEQRFRTMFENHRAVMLLIEAHSGKIVDANKAASLFYGYTKDELRLKTIEEINMLPPPKVHEERLNALKENRSYFVFPHKLKNNRIRWVEVYSSPVITDSKELLFSVIHDITSKKTAEEALRNSEARFNTVFEAMSEGVLVFDTFEKVVMANRAITDVFGFEEIKHIRDARGLFFSSFHFFSPDGELIDSDNWPVTRVLRGRSVKNFEVWMRKKNSSQRWFLSISGEPIRDEEQKQILGLIVIRDITEKKKIQEETDRRAAEQEAIFSSLPNGYVIYNTDGTVAKMNDEARRVIGYQDIMVSMSYKQRMRFIRVETPDGKKYPVDQLPSWRALHNGETVRNEVMHIVHSKGSYWISASASPILSRESKITGVVMQFADVTPMVTLQQQLESRAAELLRANEYLEAFSYSVSHDLRGPLNTIEGFVSILREDYLHDIDKDGQDLLERILNNVKKAKNLIDDILNLSKIGSLEVKREKVNVSEMVFEYLNELKENQPDRVVRFEVEKDITVDADPHLLHIAIENILRNSWKFTSKKDRGIIRFGRTKKDSRYVYFLKDNGVGFDSSYAENIFEPFKRVHIQSEYGGTGIGLSIVRRAIERHGGTIWAEGEVGKGARFYFTLGD